MLSELVNATTSVTPVGNLSEVDSSNDAVNGTTTQVSLSTAAPTFIIISASVNRPSATTVTSPTGSTNRSVSSSLAATTTMLIQTEAAALLSSRRTNSHVNSHVTAPSTPPSPGGATNQRHQHPSNVSTSPQHQQQASSSNSSSSSAPSTTRATTTSSGGLPVALLWLPYVALTLFLTTLLVASFVHFHCKNGHKYKRRRSPSSLAIGSSTTGNGNSTHWRDPIVDHIVEQSATIVCQPPTLTLVSGSVDVADGAVLVNRTTSNRAKGDGMTTRFDVSTEMTSCGNKGRSKRRQSVEFISNRNGSMVNMRGIGTSSATHEAGASSSGNRREKQVLQPSTQCQIQQQSHHSHHSDHSRLNQQQQLCQSKNMPVDESKQPLAAAFRRCTDSTASSIATGSGKTTIRSTKARIAPTRGRLGARAAIPTVDESRSTTGGGVCPSSSSSLYSAVRICKMDETAEDWNRLLAAGQTRL